MAWRCVGDALLLQTMKVKTTDNWGTSLEGRGIGFQAGEKPALHFSKQKESHITNTCPGPDQHHSGLHICYMYSDHVGRNR